MRIANMIAALLAAGAPLLLPAPADAAWTGRSVILSSQGTPGIELVRAGGGRAGGARAAGVRRPYVAPGRNVTVNRNVNVYGGWRRPAAYWWRPGAAVAAGAALGFVTTAAAASWAGAPPGPNYCWFYTDPGRTQGFWDLCP